MKVKVGATLMALSIAAGLSPVASAGSLFNRGGSMKDGYVPYMRPVSSGAGPCYVRADVGYSLSSAPNIKWPVSNIDRTTNPPTYTYVGDAVTNVSMDDSWFGETGIGCGSGSRGFRAELTLGFRGAKDIQGEPRVFTVTTPTTPTTPINDPLHTSLTSYTLMLNLYRDLGNYGGFTPYVGAGIGAAYNKLDQVYFTGNPNLLNRISGNSDLSFAWSLMAGVGYQLSERTILDFGYRFIDLGKIKSDRIDTAGYYNPAVKINDIYAHEFKIGLRYHLGGGSTRTSYK